MRRHLKQHATRRNCGTFSVGSCEHAPPPPLPALFSHSPPQTTGAAAMDPPGFEAVPSLPLATLCSTAPADMAATATDDPLGRAARRVAQYRAPPALPIDSLPWHGETLASKTHRCMQLSTRRRPRVQSRTRAASPVYDLQCILTLNDIE